MGIRVLLAGFTGLLLGLLAVAAGNLRMMRRRFRIADTMLFGRFLMMLRRQIMVFGRLLMVLLRRRLLQLRSMAGLGCTLRLGLTGLRLGLPTLLQRGLGLTLLRLRLGLTLLRGFALLLRGNMSHVDLLSKHRGLT